MRPKTIIIHDNLLKKIYFIINCFADEKINTIIKNITYESITNYSHLLKKPNF